MQSLNTPIIQVFIRPFSKPLVVMEDFHEAHNVLIHQSKDFDRSDSLGDLVKGLAPDHHIHLKTDDAWKRQRRLVQDLMTPTFLHKVAGPALHANVGRMVDLWRDKARIAEGRPWHAADDINHVALDAMTALPLARASTTARPARRSRRCGRWTQRVSRPCGGVVIRMSRSSFRREKGASYWRRSWS
jgi:cytochrome P450